MGRGERVGGDVEVGEGRSEGALVIQLVGWWGREEAAVIARVFGP